MSQHRNRVILLGIVEGDVEVRYYDHLHLSATLRLRTDIVLPREGGEVQHRTQWHRLVFRDSLARQVESYVRHGAEIEVEGVILYRKETDRNGVGQLITEIVCHRLEVIQDVVEATAVSIDPSPLEVSDELPWNDFSPNGTEDPMA